jgi:hypothetical protein
MGNPRADDAISVTAVAKPNPLRHRRIVPVERSSQCCSALFVVTNAHPVQGNLPACQSVSSEQRERIVRKRCIGFAFFEALRAAVLAGCGPTSSAPQSGNVRTVRCAPCRRSLRFRFWPEADYPEAASNVCLLKMKQTQQRVAA